MASNSQTNSTPNFCATGCGFYGDPKNRDLCSMCYKEYLKEMLIAKTKTAKTTPSTIVTTTKALPAEHEETKFGIPPPPTTATTLKQKNRCQTCRKKVGLTGFTCRCGKLFCGSHRYPEEHCCAFDFKNFELERFIKENPLVKGDKLDSRI